MIKFCRGCWKTHGDFNWKLKDYETKNGTEHGWFCREWFKPIRIDSTPTRVKDQRITHAKDIVQPHREGKPSKEFIDLYPKQSKKIFTKKEIKKAKPVWKDLKGL